MTELRIQRSAIRLIRLPAVMEMVGLSRSSIYVRIAEGTFPAPISLGGRAVAWVHDEVLGWVHERIAESRPIPEHMQLARVA